MARKRTPRCCGPSTVQRKTETSRAFSSGTATRRTKRTLPGASFGLAQHRVENPIAVPGVLAHCPCRRQAVGPARRFELCSRAMHRKSGTTPKIQTHPLQGAFGLRKATNGATKRRTGRKDNRRADWQRESVGGPAPQAACGAYRGISMATIES